MPFFYQQNINETTYFAIWAIQEPLSYFEEEMKLLVDIQNEDRKLQHLAARWLLKLMRPEIALESIEIADNGKPCLPGAPFHFSLSHCKGYAACAISETGPIGVDIEIIHERISKVAHKFLSVEEKQLVTDISEEALLKQLAFYWAAKEAMYKMYEKNGIDFSKHFNVTQLADQDQGLVPAEINHQDQDKKVQLQYLFNSDFVCVVCFDK
jgi:4'-phosphopantetheinyl transferase